MVAAAGSGVPYPVGPSTTDFYEDLGRRIAALRRSRSLSQEQLGERARVGVSYVSHIEVGSRRPTIAVLLRLADALGVPMWRLITDDRLSHDELGWEAAARELGSKLRGLTQDDLRMLSYLAERLHGAAHAQPALRAAESREPRVPASTAPRPARKRPR